jgi:hypothetical protein
MDLVAAAIATRRARNAAVWAVALFVAFVPAAFVGAGSDSDADAVQTARVMALAFGIAGLLVSILSFVLAFRHWYVLPVATRWLASLPLLVILILVAASMLIAVAS